MTLRTLTAILHRPGFRCACCNGTGRKVGPCGTNLGTCRTCHGTGATR